MVTICEHHIKELEDAIRGKVYSRGDSMFGELTSMFNGNVQTNAQIVACPLDAEDVSKIIRFSRKYSFSPSVKAGGYGTAGWAVGGDVVIDLSQLTGVEVEVPGEDGSYTSLRDMAPPNSKGKKSVTQGQPMEPSKPGTKRMRGDDYVTEYRSASHAVNDFLHPHLSIRDDLPPPSIRRRLETNGEPAAADFGHFQEFPVDGGFEMNGRAGSSSSSSSSSGLNSATVSSTSTPPASGPSHSSNSGAPFNADPFGYINAPNSTSTSATVRSSYNSTSRPVYPPWGSGSNPSLSQGGQHIMSAQAQPLHLHAYVTFGAGMKQKEIDIYTANHPLEARSVTGGDDSIPYHIPFAAHPTGSSVMLLGGFGFLSRLHGLSIDNLVEAEIVLADGEIVIVNEKESPDLWWAIRGAGPAFGIVTRYKAKAYPVPVVFAGNLIYRFHKATAPSLIKHFRDCVKGAPRELYANVLLTAGPAGQDSLIVIQMCYVGPQEKGQEFLAAISSWDGEKCLLNEVNEKSFLHQQDSVAQVLRGKAGRQWFIRSALITSLPDEVINQTVMQFSDTPIGCTWLFELAGGAIGDFENSCVPKSQRETAFNVAALHQWEMKDNDQKCVTTAEAWIAGTLKPVQAGGPLPSFLGRHEASNRTIASFGSAWSRLKELKTRYDPSNVFRNTFWPLGESGEEVDARTHEPPSPLSNGVVDIGEALRSLDGAVDGTLDGIVDGVADGVADGAVDAVDGLEKQK